MLTDAEAAGSRPKASMMYSAAFAVATASARIFGSTSLLMPGNPGAVVTCCVKLARASKMVCTQAKLCLSPGQI